MPSASSALLYLDSSALVKLVAEEPETEALLHFLDARLLRAAARNRLKVWSPA